MDYISDIAALVCIFLLTGHGWRKGISKALPVAIGLAAAAAATAFAAKPLPAGFGIFFIMQLVITGISYKLIAVKFTPKTPKTFHRLFGGFIGTLNGCLVALPFPGAVISYHLHPISLSGRLALVVGVL